MASEQNNIALDAGRQELYRRTVGDLVWATACRPDLSFEVHLLTQSLTAPTREQERQLHRVLTYLKGTLPVYLELASSKQESRGEGSESGTSSFLSLILDRSMQTNKHSLLDLVGSSFDSFLQNKLRLQTSRCRTCCGETSLRPS